MAEIDDAGAAGDGLSDSFSSLSLRTQDLASGANAFARAMTRAFSSSVTGAKQFDDVLKSLALRLSDLSVRMALKPLTSALAGGAQSVLSSLFASSDGSGSDTTTAAATPFASGGVIGTPSYFPMPEGGLGLAGEAGPEAILPLARGPDGRLGVAAGGSMAAAPSIAITVATPDLDSFRRSEAYLTGQIARAVARGQRGL